MRGRSQLSARAVWSDERCCLCSSRSILKDMVKVKGQVSEMAVLLIDPAPQIAALAKNFFNELSHKVRGGGQLRACCRGNMQVTSSL